MYIYQQSMSWRTGGAEAGTGAAGSGEAGAEGLAARMRRVNQRREKYKRSTNNSHKKFICVARKLLYKLCTYRERELFEKEFEPYQNSRVYYFIILAHVKIRMDPSERLNFNRNLTALLNAKVATYNQEIRTTNNKNFINFRFEEIADIQFALKALTLYLDDQVKQAIEVIYKKEKGFVLKKQQFEMAIAIVNELEERLKSYPPGDLFPYFNDIPKKVEIVKEKSLGTGRGKKEDDEEWVEEKNYRQSSRHSLRRDRKREITVHARNECQPRLPLLFLENSYPINPHFYSVLFSYPDPEAPAYATQSASLLPSHNNYFVRSEPNSQLGLQSNSEQSYPQAQIRIKDEEAELNHYPFLFEHANLMKYDVAKKELVPPRTTRDTMKRPEEVEDDSYQI